MRYAILMCALAMSGCEHGDSRASVSSYYFNQACDGTVTVSDTTVTPQRTEFHAVCERTK